MKPGCCVDRSVLDIPGLPDREALQQVIDILDKKRGHHLDPNLVDVLASIANPLFDDLTNGTQGTPRRKLEEILQRYFSTGFETFRPKDLRGAMWSSAEQALA
jgi:hypothetical protein